jgi:hypothetical protein
MEEERLLQVWSHSENHCAGRLLYGRVERRRYDGCVSVDNVAALARALGERVDRIEVLDQPVPWPRPGGSQEHQSDALANPETFERNLVQCILRLNTSQRKKIVKQIAALPLDERVQFVEHCNDLAATGTRTMLGNI